MWVCTGDSKSPYNNYLWNLRNDSQLLSATEASLGNTAHTYIGTYIQRAKCIGKPCKVCWLATINCNSWNFSNEHSLRKQQSMVIIQQPAWQYSSWVEQGRVGRWKSLWVEDWQVNRSAMDKCPTQAWTAPVKIHSWHWYGVCSLDCQELKLFSLRE